MVCSAASGPAESRKVISHARGARLGASTAGEILIGERDDQTFLSPPCNCVAARHPRTRAAADTALHGRLTMGANEQEKESPDALGHSDQPRVGTMPCATATAFRTCVSQPSSRLIREVMAYPCAGPD